MSPALSASERKRARVQKESRRALIGLGIVGVICFGIVFQYARTSGNANVLAYDGMDRLMTVCKSEGFPEKPVRSTFVLEPTQRVTFGDLYYDFGGIKGPVPGGNTDLSSSIRIKIDSLKQNPNFNIMDVEFKCPQTNHN